MTPRVVAGIPDEGDEVQRCVMSKRVLLEICVASVDDAIAAIEGGADRLEVNSALSLGGLTPSIGLFTEIRRRVSVPLIAMVRPRAGGFCYSPSDFEVMLRDSSSLLDAGADGLAFGVLLPNGQIDDVRCARLRKVCRDRTAVFHRAFDVTPEPLAAISRLIDLGFHRVMTSGQQATATTGAPLIAELIRRGGERIEVLPAGGIRPANVAELLTRTRCNQVHASMRSAKRDSSVATRAEIRFRSQEVLAEDLFDQTDRALVAELRAQLRRE